VILPKEMLARLSNIWAPLCAPSCTVLESAIRN
jgi:hypothetical protein